MDSKIWLMILCLLLAGCGGKSANVPPNTGEKEEPPEITQGAEQEQMNVWNPVTIAIYPFDAQDSKSNVSGQDVANLLMNRLIDVPGIEIVERSELESILNEVGLAASDLTNPAAQVAVGKLANAKLLIFGTTNKAIQLITARIVQTETSKVLSVAESDYKDDVNSVRAFAQLVRKGLGEPNPKLAVALKGHLPSQPVDPSQIKTVEVTGRGAMIDGDIVAAKEFALKDAYANAIAQGTGIQLIRETAVENFQLVRDKVLARSAGYITAYEVLQENSDPPVYEVTVRAGVSQEPLSEGDVEKLELLVKNLFGHPRIAVLIDAEAQGENLSESRTRIIQGQLASRLEQAGFAVVDAETVEAKQQQLAQSPNDEDAARLGRQLEAAVSIRGSFSTSITTRLEEVNGKKLLAPIIGATTTGAFRAINTETGDIIYTFSHEDLPDPSAQKGYGTTEEAAAGKSLENFVKASADGLIIGFTKKLGDPIQLRLELHDATEAQADQLGQELAEMPQQIVIPPSKEVGYQEVKDQKGIATYNVTTPSKNAFERKLRLTQVGGKNIIPSAIGFQTLVMRIESEAVPQDNRPTDTDIPMVRPYTGIVVDASNLGVGEMLYPKIYDENSNLVYGDEGKDRPAPGMVFWTEWMTSLDSAEANDRVKDNPLIVEAREFKNGGILISAEDATQINALEEAHGFLQQGRVVIVVSDLPYTGIVVDASGLGMNQTLYPKIYARDGGSLNLVYGDETKNRPTAGMDFWAEWASTLSEAKTIGRVKGNPLIIRAHNIENGDIVVSAEDAEKIDALEGDRHFLEQGKLVIVY